MISKQEKGKKLNELSLPELKVIFEETKKIADFHKDLLANQNGHHDYPTWAHRLAIIEQHLEHRAETYWED